MKRITSLLKDSLGNVAPFVAALLVFVGYAFLCPCATAQEPGPPPPAAMGDVPAVPENPGPPPPPPQPVGAPGKFQGPPPGDRPEGPPPDAAVPNPAYVVNTWGVPEGPPPDAAALDGPHGPRPGDGFRGPQGPGRHPWGRDAERREGPPPRGDSARDRRPMDPIQLFKAIDANGDGVITWKEFMDFHAQTRPQDGPGQCRREGPPADSKSDDRQGPPDRPRGPRPGDDMRGSGGPERGRPELSE